jgi:hypothetical protein
MRPAPGIPKDADNGCVPDRVQRRLSKEEISVGPLAFEDELSGEQMKAFVPRERGGLRVNQQSDRDSGKREQESYSNNSKLPFSRMSCGEEPISTW